MAGWFPPSSTRVAGNGPLPVVVSFGLEIYTDGSGSVSVAHRHVNGIGRIGRDSVPSRRSRAKSISDDDPVARHCSAASVTTWRWR